MFSTTKKFHTIPTNGIRLSHTSPGAIARFCGDTRPFLSERIAASHSFESFLDLDAPREVSAVTPTLVSLPVDARRVVSSASQIVTPPLFRSRMRREQVDYHEITGRLARQLGR